MCLCHWQSCLRAAPQPLKLTSLYLLRYTSRHGTNTSKPSVFMLSITSSPVIVLRLSSIRRSLAPHSSQGTQRKQNHQERNDYTLCHSIHGKEWMRERTNEHDKLVCVRILAGDEADELRHTLLNDFLGILRHLGIARKSSSHDPAATKRGFREESVG